MSELKNLVPPPELCKKIPAGNFTTTALAYYGDVFYKNISVLPRESGDCIQKDICIAPAPTLPEILIALEDMGYYCPTAFHQANTWQVDCMTETDESPSAEYLDATDPDNAAAAALKLYLELKKKQSPQRWRN